MRISFTKEKKEITLKLKDANIFFLNSTLRLACIIVFFVFIIFVLDFYNSLNSTFFTTSSKRRIPFITMSSCSDVEKFERKTYIVNNGVVMSI